MKIRLLLAIGGALALAAGGAAGASALVAADTVTVKVTKQAGPGPGGKGGTGGKRETYGTQSADCLDMMGTKQGEIVYSGPLEMWPPNHKYRNLTITATETPDADPMDTVTLATEGTHDEYLEDGTEMNGAGNTAGDVNPAADSDSGTGSAQTAHQVRGERSGRGDGRTYTFTYEAAFDNGMTECVGSFTSSVPHDQGKGNDSRRKRARR